jgi:serine/threonine protein kinase
VTETVNDRPPVVVSRACRLDEEGKETRETYTLKRFPVMEADPRRQLVAELDGLLEMPPHLVVQPVDAFMDKLDAVLVLDDEGGHYLSESVSKLGAMPERLVSIVVRQVLSALVYLHNEKMRVHNNITPANLLVLRSGELKIGGFSFSSKAFMGHTSCKFAGDYAHMAPERLLGLECGFKADVWSVGILTLELLIGASPYDMARFTGPTAIFDFKKVVVQEPSPALRRGGEHTEDARLFVDSCLNKNLKLRADCKALLVQQLITKWEVLTPNYVSRWLNKARKKGTLGEVESPNRGMTSPLNGAQDSPSNKDIVGDTTGQSGNFFPG